MPVGSKLDRRSALRVLGLTGIAGLAGCTGGDDSNGGDGSDSVLTIQHFEGPTSLNPLRGIESGTYIATEMFYSNLTILTPNPDGEGLKLEGDLATDWSSNDSNDEWIFALQEDATWHHSGNSVTAEDVKATIETITAEDSEFPARNAFGPIESVEVNGDYEAQINLSQPDVDVPAKLGHPFGRILPKDVLVEEGDSAFDSKEFGSGAFTLDNFEKGNILKASAYEDFYRQDDAGESLPYVDSVEYVFQSDQSNTLNSLRNGNIDIMFNLPSTMWEQINNDNSLTAHQAVGGRMHPLTMVPQRGPFAEKGLRDAIKYAADKEELLQGAINGFGSIATNQPISPAYRDYVDIEDKFGVNAQPEKARQALADAGYSDGFDYSAEYGTVDAPASAYPPTSRGLVLIQEQLAEVNFNIEIKEVSVDYFITKSVKKPMFMTTYGMQGAASAALDTIGHSEGSFNHGYFSEEIQPQFDEVVEAIGASSNREEKLQNVKEAMEMFQEHCGMLIPYWASALSASGTHVENYNVDPRTLTLFPEIVKV